MELQLRNVSKTYPSGVRALSNVSLTLPIGLYGLLGPHASGKSTLLRILGSLDHLDDGMVAGNLATGYLPQEPDGRALGGAETLLHASCDLESLPQLVLIDGVTSRLADPARTALMSRLCELGRTRVVVLATQRLDDIGAGCTRLAILDGGHVLLEAETCRAIDELYGRIWTREIAKEALPRVQREYGVISTKIIDGRTIVRVYSNVAPAVGFERTRPQLEDVYFSALAGHIGNRRVHVTASTA